MPPETPMDDASPAVHRNGPPPPLLSRRQFVRRTVVVGAVTGVTYALPVVRTSGPPDVATATVTGLDTAGVASSIRAPIAFSLVGFELPHDDVIEFRTSMDGNSWGPWTIARRLGLLAEGADHRSDEDRAGWRRATTPVWVGEARWLDVRGPDPQTVRAHLVDSAGLNRSVVARTVTRTLDSLVGQASADAAPYRPMIVTRSSWGADEAWRRGTTSYADGARFAVIHHTATGNDYAREDVPAILRGIYRYHTQTLGWQDIGYNFLVDRFGRVFEGRAGGVDRPVIGAHASGYNDGSIGVATLGCFDSSCDAGAPPRRMIDAVDELVAWAFALHTIDPHQTTVERGHRLPTIVGHRDVGSTACPGDRFHDHVRGSDPMRDRVLVRLHSFADVPANSTFATDIAWLAAAGITRGCNPPANDRFCPGDPVTRGQMAAFLARALGLRDARHPGFRDVPAGSTFDRDIRLIARAGITRGCNPPANDRFCPGDPVTRGQMAAFLRRALA